MSSTANTPHVLVSGGGIAGNAVALQLLRAGIRVTIVERAAAPRPGGQAVDLRGPSREVAERMGLMPGIRKYQLNELGMSYIDAKGRTFSNLSMEHFDGKGPVADIEITRGDLNQVLLDEVAGAGGDLDYRYGEWISALRQDDAGVEVDFASGRTERFDLVVGADGVHSATRRLAFGPEDTFATYLGGCMSFFTVPTPPNVRPGWFAMQFVPGATVGLRPDHDPATSKAILTVRADKPVPGLRGDVEAQHRFFAEHLTGAGDGWHAPAILDAMATTEDFYFDELVRIDMPSLNAGRVTLLGDAGYCGSPMTGMGTAMAIVGAYVLAGEIASTPNDLADALRRYEERVTPFLDEAKQLPGGGIKMMAPNTRFGQAMMRTANRVMFSRAMRPLAMKMFFSKGEDYVLPEY
ncbi:2-polyprenyl-6-methoxyphenol hydroxylase-like FAD-dependent oxidoreductase [Nocardia sp. GAS34]|uniref:FAD-dependent monooxygenase n=1 Tax=unclassified Nocardia TaxID=2637762 RepID=UPI003D24B55E